MFRFFIEIVQGLPSSFLVYKRIRFVSRVFTRELDVILFRFCFARPVLSKGNATLSVTKASARFTSP